MTDGPDPNPVNLSLPWGGDLQLDANASLVFVSGVDRIEQRIIRRFFTTPQETLADGQNVPADYIFEPTYGVGANRLIGEPATPALADELTNKINAAVMVDEGVDVSKNPDVSLFVQPNGAVWAQVTIYLLDGGQTDFSFLAKK